MTPRMRMTPNGTRTRSEPSSNVGCECEVFFFCGLFRRGERKVTYTIVTHYVLRICTGHTGLGCWLARAERLSDNGQGFFQPLVLASNDATLSGLRLGQVVHANFQRCEALPCSLAGQVVVENVCFFFLCGLALARASLYKHAPANARTASRSDSTCVSKRAMRGSITLV